MITLIAVNTHFCGSQDELTYKHINMNIIFTDDRGNLQDILVSNNKGEKNDDDTIKFRKNTKQDIDWSQASKLKNLLLQLNDKFKTDLENFIGGVA